MGAPERAGRRAGGGGRRRGRVSLAALSLLVTALALEGGLRLFWDGYYLKQPVALTAPHPTRGWANVPGATLRYGDPEFVMEVRHDAHGFRGESVARARTPGRPRILVLGDSFAYGLGVDDDETFSARLAARSPGLEVINAGVNGYGTPQQLALLREAGMGFAPDAVLVAFFWNDVGDAYREGRAAPGTAPGAARAPDPRRRALLRHSRLYRLTSDRIKLLRYRARAALGRAPLPALALEPAERERGWARVGAALREIAAVASAGGARTLLVRVPDQVEVQPEWRVLGLEPADYDVARRLAGLAAAQGIPLLDLAPVLRADHGRSGRPLYHRRDRHWNARGHRIAARAIHRHLLDRGWLEP